MLFEQRSFPSLPANLKRIGIVNSMWAFLRGLQQENCIRREQRYYDTLAKQQGLIVPSEKSLNKALMKRFSQRGIDPPNIRKGAIHTFYCGGLDIWEEHNSLAAVKAFGPVSEFHLRQQGYRPNTSYWLKDRKDFNCELFKRIKRIHQRQTIHLFFTCATGYTFFPETIEAINRLGIITCGYHMDDRLFFRGQKINGQWAGPASIAAAFDVCLTNSAASRIKYVVEGGRPFFWPAGANPETFKPLNRPQEFEVSFVGSDYGRRVDWILWLRKKGINVKAFGPGWQNGTVSTEEMVRIYASSRVNIGFSGVGYSMKETCLKGRDFEVPMCGAVYLTCEQPDLHRVYEVGNEVVSYRSKEDCLAKIRYLLSDPERCDQIRRAARHRCYRDHTWEGRFQNLFKMTGLLP